MSTKKRKLSTRELRLLLHKKHLKLDGQIKKAGLLHVAYVTVNGHVRTICDGRYISLLDYYYFPYLSFIVSNAPVCDSCIVKLKQERQPPFSNTGVNSNGGMQDDSQ